MENLQITVVQDNFNDRDEGKNIAKFIRHIEACMEEEPMTKLVLFPEAAATGYVFDEEHVRTYAEIKEGPFYQAISQIAKKFEIYICYGFIEKQIINSKNYYFNSLNFVGKDGVLMETYQKIHLTPLEKHLFTAGNRIVTVNTELGSIGLLICWDLAFPYLSKLLVNKGAELLLAPSAWESPFEKAYQRMAVARAIDNTCFLATCNFTGGEDEIKFFGQSAIYNPEGDLINKKPINEVVGFQHAQIDLSIIAELKATFYSMEDDQRRDLFTLNWTGDESYEN